MFKISGIISRLPDILPCENRKSFSHPAVLLPPALPSEVHRNPPNHHNLRGSFLNITWVTAGGKPMGHAEAD